MNKLLLPANDLATTHALLRRATLPSGIYCLLFSGYNSRSSAESDSIIIVRPSHIVRYNSRSPAESDLGTMVSVRKGMRYNSRSPAESDAYASAS